MIGLVGAATQLGQDLKVGVAVPQRIEAPILARLWRVERRVEPELVVGADEHVTCNSPTD